MYDIVLIEKPGESGLNRSEINKMLTLLNSDEMYPIEIFSHNESSAMGFIGTEAANKLDYDYKLLSEFLADIMDDMTLESESGKYYYKDIPILMTRNIDTENEWIQTDDYQYCRRIGDKVYQLIEASEVDGKYILSDPGKIDINNYVSFDGNKITYNEECQSFINAYYSGGYEEFEKLVPDPDFRWQQLAEIIYECKSQLLPTGELMTESEVEKALQTYIKYGVLPE